MPDITENVVEKKKKLRKLDQYEQKYVTEKDSALQQYLDTKQEAENIDSSKLMDVKLLISTLNS